MVGLCFLVHRTSASTLSHHDRDDFFSRLHILDKLQVGAGKLLAHKDTREKEAIESFLNGKENLLLQTEGDDGLRKALPLTR